MWHLARSRESSQRGPFTDILHWHTVSARHRTMYIDSSTATCPLTSDQKLMYHRARQAEWSLPLPLPLERGYNYNLFDVPPSLCLPTVLRNEHD